MYCTYTHTRLRLFAVALALIACAARASPRFTERVWLRQTTTGQSAVSATISVKTASETPSSSTNSQPNTDAQQLSTVPTPINAPPATGPTVAAISAVSPTTTPVITASEISSSSTDSQPAFSPTSSTHFRWGDVTSKTFCEDIGKAYEEQTL